jgi:hypothetical protein
MFDIKIDAVPPADQEPMVELLIGYRMVPYAGEKATHSPAKNTIADNQPLSNSMVSLSSHMPLSYPFHWRPWASVPIPSIDYYRRMKIRVREI